MGPTAPQRAVGPAPPHHNDQAPAPAAGPWEIFHVRGHPPTGRPNPFQHRRHRPTRPPRASTARSPQEAGCRYDHGQGRGGAQARRPCGRLRSAVPSMRAARRGVPPTTEFSSRERTRPCHNPANRATLSSHMMQRRKRTRPPDGRAAWLPSTMPFAGDSRCLRRLRRSPIAMWKLFRPPAKSLAGRPGLTGAARKRRPFSTVVG